MAEMFTANSSVWSNLQHQYNYLFEESRDPRLESVETKYLKKLKFKFFRVDDWLLMSSPWPTAGLCLLYYYIIRVAGPNYMKNREPFNIQNIVVFYNLFQTIFSIWIFAKATKFWFTGVICYIK